MGYKPVCRRRFVLNLQSSVLTRLRCRRAETDLGMRWKPLEQTIREAAEQVFEFERRDKRACAAS